MGHRQGPPFAWPPRDRRRSRPGRRSLGRLNARVALATCRDVPDLDEDGPELLAALGRRGISAIPAVWDDPAIEWEAFDLVVIRSTWDYAERYQAFLTWIDALPSVANPATVLRWSADKRRYLTDLAAAGVPAVPTDFVEPGAGFDPPAASFVIKPSVSAGGRSSARFGPGDARARSLVDAIHAEGRTAMVQEYLADVAETALVYIDGAFSHATRRRVPLPVGTPQPGLFLEEELARCEATATERCLAEEALALAPGEFVYARVDLAPVGGGEPVVLELELVEPSLYLWCGDGAIERMAQAIADQLLAVKTSGARVP